MITVMYHELRHEQNYTGNTIIIEFKQYINGTRDTKYFGDLCCIISINVSTCNINMSILTSIHIKKVLGSTYIFIVLVKV